MFTLCEHYRPVITRLQVRTYFEKENLLLYWDKSFTNSNNYQDFKNNCIH